ncbi:hypothetical protein BSLG_009741 [Batrachochytrium salamandrivorans]|nr:hypothetical protein BSLG_009741 [Batrachochytrium salamandrivorans]
MSSLLCLTIHRQLVPPIIVRPKIPLSLKVCQLCLQKSLSVAPNARDPSWMCMWRGIDCINRQLSLECSVEDCSTGSACKNRRFQLCEYAPIQVARAGLKGFGVFAMEDIPMGTFIIEYCGEVISASLFHKRTFIDASKKGKLLSVLNHSCDPNLYTSKVVGGRYVRIGLLLYALSPREPKSPLIINLKDMGARLSLWCICLHWSIGGSRSASNTLSSDSNQSESEDDDEDDDESGSDDDKSSRSSSIGLGRSSVEKSQSSSRKLARKSIEDHVLYRKFLGLHGLDVMRNCVFSTKYHFEVVKLVVDILHKLPITSRNPVILLMKLEEMTQKQTIRGYVGVCSIVVKTMGHFGNQIRHPKAYCFSISDAHRDGSIVSGSLPSMPIAGSNGSGLIPTSDAFLSPVTALSVAAATDLQISLSTPSSLQSHRVSARSLNDTLTSSYSAAVVAAGPAGCTSTNGIARSSSHLPTTASAQDGSGSWRDRDRNTGQRHDPSQRGDASQSQNHSMRSDRPLRHRSRDRSESELSSISRPNTNSSRAQSRSLSRERHRDEGRRDSRIHCNISRDRSKSRDRGRRQDSRDRSRSGDRGRRQDSRDRRQQDRSRSRDRGRRQDSRDRSRSRDRGRRQDSRDRSRSRDRGRRQDSRDRSRSRDRGRRQDSRDRSRSRDRGRRQDSRDRSRSRDRGRRQDSRDRSRSRGGKYESTRNSSRCSSRDSNRRRSRQCDTQRDRSRSAVRHVNQTDRYEGRYRADQHRSSAIALRDEHLEIPRALGSDKNGDDCSSESQDIKHVKDIHHSDRDVEIRRDTNLPYVNCTDAVHSRMTASGLCSPQSRSVKIDTLVEVWMPDSGVATTSDLTLDNNLSSGVSTLKRKSDITMSDMAIGHHVKRFPKPHSKSSNISHPRSYGQIDIKANKPHASEMIDSKQGQTYMSERQGLHSARGATSSTLVSNDDIKLAKKELHGIAIKQLSKFADMFWATDSRTWPNL